VKKLLIIGPIPKPYGGVSIHINRLNELVKSDYTVNFIDESKNIKQNYFNIYSLNFLGYIKRLYDADIIHIHSGSSITRITHIIFSKILLKKIVVTVHSFGRKNKIAVGIDRFFINLADKIIVVNDLIKEILGGDPKIVVQYAFIPPNIDEESNLSISLSDFIRIRKAEGKKILIANAWRLDVFKNEDLYGLDMCINLMYDLINANKNVVFIFVVSSLDKYSEKFLSYQSRIKELNLQDFFILINESLSFSKLITFSDIVLRPTNTDGDALTIREAIFFNKTVIASNIVPRPKGTLLFNNRDRVSLFNQVDLALRNIDVIKNVYEEFDFRTAYLNIYKSCVE
jgi:hypothetical protein